MVGLEAFRRRNTINLRASCGESTNIDKEAADDWKRHLAAVVEGYAIEDQFNTDETAMFYRGEVKTTRHWQCSQTTCF